MPENTLDLDIGNSRTKWRYSCGASSCLGNGEIENIRHLIGVEKVERIRISCVADDAFRLKMSGFLEDIFFCRPVFAQPHQSAMGLVNLYMPTESLGVDRWLACLAAWHKSECRPVLVIDVGSALTIDTVGEKSEFLGGYIIPGFRMMQKSLLDNTGRIVCDIDDDFEMDIDVLPMSTREAVQKGAMFAIVAAVERSIRLFCNRWSEGDIYFTGGGGDMVRDIVDAGGVYEPDLVLDGLALALP